MMLNHKHVSIVAILLVLIGTIAKGQIALRLPEYYIKDSDTMNIIRLELTGLESIEDKSKLTIIKKGVRFGQRSDEDLFNAFTVDKQVIEDHSIRVTIKTRKTHSTGIYELSLDVFDGKSYKPLLVKFNHQPAVLKDLADVTITQQAPFFSSHSIIKSSPLTLQETSGNSQILTTLSDIPFNWNASDQKFSAIHFKQSSIMVEPGRKMPINYVTEGSFPLGETKLTSEIMAPQLSTAKPLTFIVITKRPLYYIVILLFLGIFFSLGFKTVLTNFISLNDLKLKLIDFIDLITKDQLVHLDSKFKAKSDEIIRELSEAAALKLSVSTLIVDNESEKSRIENLLASKKTEYETAIKDLDDRRQNAIKIYEDLLAILVPLPTSLQVITQSVIFDKKEQISQYLKEDNIIELENLLKNIKDHFLGEMQIGIDNWKNKVADLVALLSDHLKPYLTDDVELNTKLASLDTSSIKTPETLDDVKTAIPLINTVHHTVKEVVGSYTMKLLTVLIKTKPILQQRYKSSEKLDKLESSMLTYRQHVRSADLEELSGLINREDKQVVDAWKEMIYQPPLTAPNSEIETSFANHRFEEAVQTAVQLIKNPSSNLANNAPAIDFQKPYILSANREVDTFKNYVFTVPTNATFHGTIELNRRIIENSSTTVKVIRLLMVAIALIFIGYFVYDDNFIGKPDELFGIFLWAFTFDLSINTSFDFISTALSKSKTVLQ